MARGGWVYILASRYQGTIYIGVTASLAERINQHRSGERSEFAAMYQCRRLVHVEPFDAIEDTIQREKRLKKRNRQWKIRLIEEANPDWLDLYDELLQ